MMEFTTSLSLLVVVTTSIVVRAAAPPEVLQGWYAYTERFQHAVGKYHSKASIQQGNHTSTQSTEASFAFGTKGRRLELLITDSEMRKPIRRLLCENPKYLFQLNWSGNGWLLDKVILLDNGPGDEKARAIQEQLTNGLSGLHALVAVNGDRLTDLADHLEPSGNEGGVLSLVKEYSTVSGRNTRTYRSLSLQLNPDEYHTVRSATAELRVNKSEGTLTVTCDYQFIDGLPVPLRSNKQEVYRSPGDPLEIHDETHYQIDPRIDPPETEFTLSAFGLPEPVGVTWEKPTPIYVWLILAAAGFGVLALLFRWLMRRRQAAAAA
jgi:hypothetical protein